jgi:hypothetical protein
LELAGFRCPEGFSGDLSCLETEKFDQQQRYLAGYLGQMRGPDPGHGCYESIEISKKMVDALGLEPRTR